MRRAIIAIVLAGIAITVSAQKLDAAFFDSNPDAAGGIYYTYRFTPTKTTEAPKGYKPF